MYYIGMMSGTSLDGVDAVLAHYQPKIGWQVINHINVGFPQALKSTLYQLNFSGAYQHEIHTAAQAEQQLTHCYAETYQKLLKTTLINADEIVAIGAHGQTIRHEPHGDTPYTIQLINGALLAYLTQQTVVCDFRCKDIAAGGQGAPLAPIFHQQLFHFDSPYAVVNIGGIANVSLIDPDNNRVSGFDCGPGNCLLDEWIQQHQGKHFDAEGQWASQGQVSTELLNKLLTDAYFSRPPPKSSGRDYFQSTWLTRFLNGSENPVDVMATLTMLTVQTIRLAIPNTYDHIVVVGGGANNQFLCQLLTKSCAPTQQLHTARSLGLDAQHVEALGFALLAKSCLAGIAIDTRTTTGAKQAVICGAIYQ